MPFHIEWSPDALDMLADIWMYAGDRAAVNAAENRIETLLARNPLTCGQAVHEGLYRMTAPPLTVSYSVDPAQKIVEILAVRYTP